MRLSTIALLTLATFVSQDSCTEASPIPDELTNGLSNLSELSSVDEVETIALAPSLAVSMPEMIENPSFSSTEFSSKEVSSASITNVLDQTWLATLVKMSQGEPQSSIKHPISVAQMSPGSSLNYELTQTITLLNTLLIVATLVPSLTILFFWLVRRLIVKEIVEQAQKKLNHIENLETKLKVSKQRYQQLIKELELQIATTQESVNFLTREAKASKSSIEQVETLKSQFIFRLQGMISEVQDLKEQALKDLHEKTLETKESIQALQNQNSVSLKGLSSTSDSTELFSENSIHSPILPSTNSSQSSQLMIADDYLKKGESFFLEGQFKEALTCLEQAITANPQLEQAWFKKATILARLQRYFDALDAYNQYLNLNPGKYDGWYNRGNILVRLQRYEEAIASYDQAIKIKPNDYESWHNRGAILRKFKIAP